MTRIGLLVNPTAGRGRAAGVGRVALEQLRAAGHDVVDLTASDGGAAAGSAREFLLGGGTGDDLALVAVGGDGVVNLAANAILAHAPHVPLGLVPAGTGDDTARALGLPRRDPVAAVARLLAALARPPQVVDVGVVGRAGEGGDGDAEDGGVAPPHRRYFVGVLSAGIDAAVNARANRLRWPRGPLRYVVALAVELAGFRGFAIRVVADGADAGGAGTLVAVANTRSIGGGMRIAPDASWTDGLLEVVTARTIPRRTLAVIFPRVYAGTHVGHPVVQVTRASEVLLLRGESTSTGAGTGRAGGRRRPPAPAPSCTPTASRSGTCRCGCASWRERCGCSPRVEP
ncbi:diacylglycerol/lipid kinase family protein [Litorihabitans aurantiacus]|uniref:Sphingosine kinase n=1 Tax=Litorihabitans aurantiacus TaxID=1930061 RepID=A0AA37XDJ7_9MICO|nr:diacylglycerol kinase family protein [Litorihabitans aurantiacus]GMA31273.1 sphingosine kinase [Litorihabitans aurantiacus]